MTVNIFRRRLIVQYLYRYKFIVVTAVFFLFTYMVLGSSHKDNDVAGKPAELKAKEYPDFDYKYDKERMKLKAQEVHFAEPAVSPQSKFDRPALRRQGLNGVSGNLGSFDVVGGADLFRQEVGQLDEFAADDAKVVPGLGEMGEPVHLSGAEAAEAEERMKTEAFNIIASDKISLHRAVPDTRDPRCKTVRYDKELPTTSVIIIFTNEAWSPLIRTIWSVLEKTDERLLHEIILVDDFSDKKHLKGKLDRYIQKKFPSKVRLLRLPERQGLIRARLAGAKLATGDALLFLDSHCECGDDWLRPLLQRIKEDRRAFVVPIIDVIDDKTLEYYHGNGIYFQIGGFTWSGHFTWIDIPDHEQTRRGSPIGPTRTPTMAGGLFAVDREYFWEIGSYDEEMDVWGGENLEMSFRVWQCGGLIETIPCSRVGHIFRSFHPYSFPGNKDTHGINTARTVEVWMDDYKRLFYMNRPDLLTTDIGDVKKRNEFKKRMQCKPFSWYLDNIYPQKFILDDPDHVIGYGRLKNAATGTCLDTLQNDEKDNYDLGIYQCHDFMSSSQFFSYSKKRELRRDDACAELDSLAGAGFEAVRMAPCRGVGGSQEWIHTKEGRFVHKQTRKCLDARGGNSMDQLYAGPCKTIATQHWKFDHYTNSS